VIFPQLLFALNTSEERANKLFREVKCPVCSGQSLAESNAYIAENLKEIIVKKILEGDSDQEIKTFLVSAYGEDILFEPPLNPYTYIIWYGPFLLLGACIILAQIRLFK
jgi:cytochrome c-type biogenesis protein CcmH